MLEELTGIVAIISVFGMPVFIVLVIAIFYYRTQRLKYRTAVELAKTGHPVPETLFRKDNIESSVRQMKVGLIYLAIGVGMALSSFAMGFDDLWGVATIPGLIGVAYLITAWVSHRTEKSNIEEA